MSLGVNLSYIDYFSSQLPFLNEFKSSRSWFTQSEQTWNTNEEDLLNLDSDGWVTSLPDSGESAEYTSAATLLFREHGDYLPGNYIVLYEGEGEIEYDLDATKNEALSTPGRDVIEVDPSNSGILLNITETDPDGTGDYIRDIKVVHEAFESIADTETFNPEFVDKVEPFDTLRYMNWMETNNSDQQEWEDRPTVEDARYGGSGVPLEVLVELSNETDSNPWFNIPHLATDEYVENFAQYVKENLDPDLEVYVEYSNEVWNRNFEQGRWADEQAKQELGPGFDRRDFYSKRTTEVIDIWEEVFAEESERIVGIMSAQANQVEVGEQVLAYNWSDDPNLSNEETGVDAIAINAYFGRYIGQPNNEAEVEEWLDEPDGGLNSLFQEITEGGLLTNGVEGGALAQGVGNIEAYANLAREENLPLIAYEGGQHLAANRKIRDNEGIIELFAEANRDPRMGEIYEEYLSEWFRIGGDLFLNYSDVRSPSKSGNWGLLESVYQDSSPKYDALVNSEFLTDGSETL